VKGKFYFSTFSKQIWSFYLEFQLIDRFQSHIVGLVMFSSNVLQFAKESKERKKERKKKTTLFETIILIQRKIQIDVEKFNYISFA